VAWWDEAARRVAAVAEERLGVTVRSTDRVEQLEVREREFAELADEVEELTLRLSDFFRSRPTDPDPEGRMRLVQLSRLALRRDPLAAAEAQLLGDFSLSRGVQMPAAKNEEVQKRIERAWTDPINEQRLTSFEAQRKVSNDLITAGEVFFTAYVANGRVVLGRRQPEDVVDIVTDPDDVGRPLYYVVKQRAHEWDMATDQPKVKPEEIQGNGQPKVLYFDHWRNVELAKRERELTQEKDTRPFPVPLSSKHANGKIFHLAINTTGTELRGSPPWARSLRFFEAMNELTEAHVAMAQASQQIIARRVMTGSRTTIQKAVASVESQLSEMGVARGARFDGPQQGVPGAPGSIWNDNQASKLESLKLSSGAAEMVSSGMLVRAPISAASGFGQHYLGHAGDTNLATASTLELPSTMRVQTWQRYLESIFRWFTDLVIEVAVQAGDLGGSNGYPEEPDLSELCIWEAEDRTKMEERTKRSLDYDFSMPFPGRRQLAEVVEYAAAVCSTMDPNGVNIPLRRLVLRFVLEPLQLDNVGDLILELLPDDGSTGIGPGRYDETGQPLPPGVSSEDEAKITKARKDAAELAAQGGAAGGGTPGATGKSAEEPKGVRRNGSKGEGRATEGMTDEEVRRVVAEVQAAWDGTADARGLRA
jgi:hypothetical protein